MYIRECLLKSDKRRLGRLKLDLGGHANSWLNLVWWAADWVMRLARTSWMMSRPLSTSSCPEPERGTRTWLELLVLSHALSCKCWDNGTTGFGSMHACVRIRCSAAVERVVEWDPLGVLLSQCKKRGHLSHLTDHPLLHIRGICCIPCIWPTTHRSIIPRYLFRALWSVCTCCHSSTVIPV